MNASVSNIGRRYIQRLNNQLMEQDDLTRAQAWLVWPRGEAARVVSAAGQAIMRLGHRIHDSAFDGDEHAAWDSGYRCGRLAGLGSAPREEIERTLIRLGLDASEETMAKFGYKTA